MHPSSESMVTCHFIIHKLCRVRIGKYDFFFIGNKPSLVRRFLNILSTILKFGASSVASRFGQFGLSTMTRYLTKKQWHQSKVKHLIWVDLIICTPRWLGRGWWNLSRLVPTQPKPSWKVSTRCRELGTFFVEETKWGWLGIGNCNAHWKLGPLFVPLVASGLFVVGPTLCNSL